MLAVYSAGSTTAVVVAAAITALCSQTQPHDGHARTSKKQLLKATGGSPEQLKSNSEGHTFRPAPPNGRPPAWQ